LPLPRTELPILKHRMEQIFFIYLLFFINYNISSLILYLYIEQKKINLYNFDSILKLSDLVFFNDLNIFRTKFSSGGSVPAFRYKVDPFRFLEIAFWFCVLVSDWFHFVF
jgi:hypothetical protein